MDSKGEESKMSYPNIFFMIDSFEEVSVHRWVPERTGLQFYGQAFVSRSVKCAPDMLTHQCQEEWRKELPFHFLLICQG